MSAPEQSADMPPASLHWILPDAEQHFEAWARAAHWVHANTHLDIAQRTSENPCHDCWRAAVFALKAVVLTGYRPQPEQPGPVQPPADLHQRIAQAARTVRLRLGPNAIGMAQRGESIPLSGGEADELTAAALAVVEPELAALREQLAAAEDELLRTRVRLLARDSENDRLTAERTDLTRLLDHSERRRESTVVEARRQAARVDAAQAENDRLRALLARDHAAAYHQGEPRDGLLWHCGRDHCTAPSTPPST